MHCMEGKDHASHLYNGLRCQGVSNDGTVCSFRGHVPFFGEMTVFFLEEMYIEPAVHVSHIFMTNTSCPQH